MENKTELFARGCSGAGTTWTYFKRLGRSLTSETILVNSPYFTKTDKKDDIVILTGYLIPHGRKKKAENHFSNNSLKRIQCDVKKVLGSIKSYSIGIDITF